MGQATDVSIMPSTPVRDPLPTLGELAASIEAQLERLEDDPRDVEDISGGAELFDQHSGLLAAIAAAPAETIAGLRVKAERVLAYRDWNDPANQPDADVAIALSICRDLIRLSTS